MDMQDWALIQQIRQRKTHDCLPKPRTLPNAHQEGIFGIELYVDICGDYMDIFMSCKLSLRGRIVLATKVSFPLCFGAFN